MEVDFIDNNLWWSAAHLNTIDDQRMKDTT